LVQLWLENNLVQQLPECDDPRTIIIGDVHGCYEELVELLAKASYNPTKDRLIFVGDLVGKGPFSKQVVDLAIEYDAECIRGNHDHIVIEWYLSDGKRKVKPTYLDIAKSFTQDNWNYLLSCDYYIELEDEHALLVHAGVEPGKSLAEQDPFVLMNIRNILDGAPSKSQDGQAWVDTWEEEKLIIFGHDAVRGIQVREFDNNLIALGIDSGAVYGGTLSAFVFPERKLIQTPAHKMYEKPSL